MSREMNPEAIPALDRFGEQLSEATRRFDRERGRRIPVAPQLGRRTIAIAAVLMVLFASIALTPQGRAVADQILDWIGIGDDPTTTLPNPIDRPDVVIGTGLTPNGVRYEVVASADRETAGLSPKELTCARIDLLDVRSGIIISCLSGRDAHALADATVGVQANRGPTGLGPDRIIIEGFAPPNVDRVELRYADKAGAQHVVETQVSRFDQSLADQIGAPLTATFVVAFLPLNLVPEAPPLGPRDTFPDRDFLRGVESVLRGIRVVAFDSSGEQLSDVPLSRTADAHTLYPPQPNTD